MSIIDTHVSDNRHLSVIDTLHYPDILICLSIPIIHSCVIAEEKYNGKLFLKLNKEKLDNDLKVTKGFRDIVLGIIEEV